MLTLDYDRPVARADTGGQWAKNPKSHTAGCWVPLKGATLRHMRSARNHWATGWPWGKKKLPVT